VLNQYAPTWLFQLPAVLGNLDLDLLQRKTAGATRERMLRELAEALEVLTTERPLVLVLEDVHWSDLSTLELLSYLARRRHSCRLLVLGTYRPIEMFGAGHPLQRVLHELYAHDPGREMALLRLTESEVNTYLTLRFPESVLPIRLGPILQQRTGGNPLFLTSLVQNLLQRRMLRQEEEGRWAWHGDMAEVERWTPESVYHVLARQRERLTQDEQRVLAAASLAGAEFSAAAVAAALETQATEVEEH
jgi:predicted ATPase